jgi:hypothetical protein
MAWNMREISLSRGSWQSSAGTVISKELPFPGRILGTKPLNGEGMSES